MCRKANVSASAGAVGSVAAAVAAVSDGAVGVALPLPPPSSPLSTASAPRSGAMRPLSGGPRLALLFGDDGALDGVAAVAGVGCPDVASVFLTIWMGRGRACECKVNGIVVGHAARMIRRGTLCI